MKDINSLFDTIKTATMEGFGLYSLYFIKLSIKTKALFSSPSGIVSGLFLVSASLLSTIQMALLLLLGLFTLDFVTGVWASWTEQKKEDKLALSAKLTPLARKKLELKIKGKNFISSEKLKLSLVKVFTYTSVILAIHMVELVFQIKPYEVTYLSEIPMTITLIFIGFCCAIEFYSVFFENFKRLGYDIPGKIKSSVKGIKQFFSEVKKEE